MPDTRLAVYEGASLAALTLDERNDDDALSELRSRVVIDAVGGRTYRVQIGDAPGQAAGPRILRWYASPPDPEALCALDPGNFTSNPSLEADATGWGASAASVSAGDLFQRYVGDGASGGVSAEVALSGTAGTGLAYTDAAAHNWHVAATVTVWLRVVGGTPRTMTFAASVNGARLVPAGGLADYTGLPTGTWQRFALAYDALEQTGPLVLTITVPAGGPACVLRADCLQAVSSPAPPDAPGNLACAPAATAIRLTWSASPGADGYYVRRDGALIATLTALTYTDTPLPSGLAFGYTVSAFSEAGGESPVAALSCATTATSLAKPLDASCDALGFLELNGREVANEARTAGYLAAGLGSPFWQMDGAACLILSREIGAAVPSDPAIDPAPWYDAARPESGDFLGLWPKVRLVRHTTRQVAAKLTGLGGAVLGQQRPGATEVQITAALLSRSSAGADYGRRWLENTLRNVSSDPCGLATLRLRLACPPDDGSNDTLGEVYLYDVGLAGDVQDGQVQTLDAACCEIMDVSFSLTAGEASVYHRTRLCVQGEINTDPGSCVPFCEWLTGHDDGSYSTSVACAIESPSLFGEVGVIATIAAGGQVVRNVEVAIYQAGACPPLVGATPLGVVQIPTLPAGSALVYDSARRIVTFYASAADAAVGANALPGIAYITIPDGQAIPWLTANPSQPAGCIVVGKRGWCGGAATVRIDTQLREA